MVKSTGKKKANVVSRQVRSAVDEFDREFVIDTFSEPSSEELAHWKKARKKRGRPKQGEGVKVISVSVERELLDRSDTLARKMRISRAKLIARGLKAVLAAEGEI